MSSRAIPQRLSSLPVYCNDRKKALEKFLDIDCKSGKIDITQAHQFFNQMLYMKPQLPPSCFSKLLSGLVKCDHFSVAISFYKRLNVVGLFGLRSNPFILSILLNCYSSMKIGRSAGYSAFGLVLKNGYRPSIWTFTSLVKGLCVEEKVVEAVRLLSKMIRLGYGPHIIAYNTISNGLCKTGNVTTALALHQAMVCDAKKGCRPGTISYTLNDGSCIEWPMVDAKGREVRFSPNVVSYGCLIDELCRLGMDEDAMSLLDEMIRRGIHPDVVTNNILINMLCKKGRAEEARKILDLMISKCKVPDIFTYSTLVDGYCKIGKMEDAVSLYKDMTSRGVSATTVTMNALLKGLYLERKVEDAMTLFKTMKKMDVSGACGPSNVTYIIMIDGLCKEGHVDKAEEIFLEMQGTGVSLDNHAYSSMIDGLCKQGHVGKAHKLFSEMLASDVSPNVVVYSALIDGLCKKGDMHKAKELFLQMQDSGISPTVISYSSIVDGFYRCGNVEEANAMLEKMIGEGILPNAVTFTIIMRNLGRKGDQTARNVIFMMESCGYVCDVESYNALIKGCCEFGELNNAYNLLAEMVDKGCSPNIKTYSTLIRGFAREKDSERVKELTRKMHNIRTSSDSDTILALLKSIEMDDKTQRSNAINK